MIFKTSPILIKRIFPQKTFCGRLARAVRDIIYGPPPPAPTPEPSPEELRTAFFEILRKLYPHYLPERDGTLPAEWQWLVAAGQIICPEYRFQWPQLDWWKDDDFNQYLVSIDELKGFNAARRWNVKQLLKLVSNIEGDMAECGVYKGATAALLLNAARANVKRECHLHLFDSFEGLSEPTNKDGSHWGKGFLSAGEDMVVQILQTLCPDYSNYTLYKGWIPECFDTVADKRFSFVHIDVDLYEPTKASIEFFYPRLSEGGICVCDDYGFSTCLGATRAMDEFMADKPEKIIYSASGAGFFIKGIPTT